MDEIRKRIENNEYLILCKGAAFSAESKGRLRQEELDPLRTCWQRDRDRIIHTKSFRRLKHKTQVFLSPEGDHYRTRLTHTLEVSQIARTISRSLMLNEDLTEAIAMGHDLGHTPFGHAGERALNAIFPDGFRHYEQSVRVVDLLEKGGKGLNLTMEVRDGIVCHTKGKEADTLEGRVVRISDRIAYINHDIDDALRAGIITEGQIPDEVHKLLGYTTSTRINALVTNTVKNSSALSENIGENYIRMGEEMWSVFDKLNDFMFDNVYLNPECKSEEKKAIELIGILYEHFCRHEDELPEEYEHIAREEGIKRAVCDYIAGMTDGYAVEKFREIYIPLGWGKM